jgi:hypothetical protein
VQVCVDGVPVCSAVSGEGVFVVSGGFSGDVRLVFTGPQFHTVLTVPGVRAGETLDVTVDFQARAVRIDARQGGSPDNGRDERQNVPPNNPPDPPVDDPPDRELPDDDPPGDDDDAGDDPDDSGESDDDEGDDSGDDSDEDREDDDNDSGEDGSDEPTEDPSKDKPKRGKGPGKRD